MALAGGYDLRGGPPKTRAKTWVVQRFNDSIRSRACSRQCRYLLATSKAKRKPAGKSSGLPFQESTTLLARLVG
ncbi:hypothetical protein TRIATDRAFT_301774 [Trichoderma atroviride IMI 206040]|uniref:Uncharacterized protein n=1 Tax=Hypocrea atroviridis (strain ATCC 20476 / IMI 206040) TaxID=452589 RepID=G9P434_HYPAI|nr:uncharacterized protein TRIATDRAFT_301774 [Trichoderma atroviride IMI 206040]EHK41090.1 hypothetical protein TRIATDRAFT_301774 [Trichoderma atroviride IMI 206040]